jgi:hypothetical protein
MELKRKILIAVLGLMASGAVLSTASAETRFDAVHPRQAEVLHRAAHQRHLIRMERREGKISPAKAHRLLVRERAVVREDRAMARANGGHITKVEQKTLNHQETVTRRHIPS